LAFSPDGRTLALGTERKVCLLEVATGLDRGLCPAGALAAAFSPDGLSLAFGSWDTTAGIWDVTGRQEDGRLRRADLTAKEVGALWDDLGHEESERAYRAVWTLTAGVERALPLLREKLRPALGEIATIRRTIRELDSKDFRTREKASGEL